MGMYRPAPEDNFNTSYIVLCAVKEPSRIHAVRNNSTRQWRWGLMLIMEMDKKGEYFIKQTKK